MTQPLRDAAERLHTLTRPRDSTPRCSPRQTETRAPTHWHTREHFTAALSVVDRPRSNPSVCPSKSDWISKMRGAKQWDEQQHWARKASTRGRVSATLGVKEGGRRTPAVWRGTWNEIQGPPGKHCLQGLTGTPEVMRMAYLAWGPVHGVNTFI